MKIINSKNIKIYTNYLMVNKEIIKLKLLSIKENFYVYFLIMYLLIKFYIFI